MRQACPNFSLGETAEATSNEAPLASDLHDQAVNDNEGQKMQLLAVALICAISTPYGECRRDTALDVIAMPVAMPFQCAMQGQALVAGSALAERLNGTAYLKVACERRRV